MAPRSQHTARRTVLSIPAVTHTRPPGLGHGSYPFGSAGLDLLLLGLLRPLVVAATCLTYHLALKRANFRKEERQDHAARAVSCVMMDHSVTGINGNSRGSVSNDDAPRGWRGLGSQGTEGGDGSGGGGGGYGDGGAENAADPRGDQRLVRQLGVVCDNCLCT